MTAIFYPNAEAESPSGRFLLEARSPHNRPIRHRNGRITPGEAEFACKFRYRLLERDPERNDPVVVWERFQPTREESSHELLVADDGWAVIRTHGFDPEIIAVGPDGRDALRIRLTGTDDDEEEEDQGPHAATAAGRPKRPWTGLGLARFVAWLKSEPQSSEPRRPPKSRGASESDWVLAHLESTTAGEFWSANSWPTFFVHGGRTCFAWRAWWGQRLVLDLENAVAYPDEQLLPMDLHVAALEAERAGVRALLNELSGRMEEVRTFLRAMTADDSDKANRLRGRMERTGAALHLVGVHRLGDCVPFLREWEEPDVPLYRTQSTAMTGRWSLEAQHFRPIVHHALKRLDEEPQGFPTYGFVEGALNYLERFPMPAHLPDRGQRALNLDRKMSAEDVLRLLGSPDFIRRHSRPEGRAYRWSEDWEYDLREAGRWRTLRITWEEVRQRGRIAGIEAIAPYWLDFDGREREILRL